MSALFSFWYTLPCLEIFLYLLFRLLFTFCMLCPFLGLKRDLLLRWNQQQGERTNLNNWTSSLHWLVSALEKLFFIQWSKLVPSTAFYLWGRSCQWRLLNTQKLIHREMEKFYKADGDNSWILKTCGSFYCKLTFEANSSLSLPFDFLVFSYNVST